MKGQKKSNLEFLKDSITWDLKKKIIHFNELCFIINKLYGTDCMVRYYKLTLQDLGAKGNSILKSAGEKVVYYLPQMEIEWWTLEMYGFLGSNGEGF